MQQLISCELLAHGFTQGRGETYKYEGIVVNLSKGTIREQEKQVVLFMNDRYIRQRLFKDLLDFFAPESEDDVKGKKLAQAFSDAGIRISQENFVQLYKKIYLSKSI
jgi:hypothetical protein